MHQQFDLKNHLPAWNHMVKDSINESLISAQENAEEIKKRTNTISTKFCTKLLIMDIHWR